MRQTSQLGRPFPETIDLAIGLEDKRLLLGGVTIVQDDLLEAAHARNFSADTKTAPLVGAFCLPNNESIRCMVDHRGAQRSAHRWRPATAPSCQSA